MELSRTGEDVFGLTIERNFNGEPNNRSYGAEIVGNLKGEKLDFVKTYFPWTGMKHSVAYSGEFDFKRGAIVGVWYIPDKYVANPLVGSFKMHLDEGEYFNSIL